MYAVGEIGIYRPNFCQHQPYSLLLLASIMFMEILLMICIPNYMMFVLFQQCCMVLKYLDK